MQFKNASENFWRGKSKFLKDWLIDHNFMNIDDRFYYFKAIKLFVDNYKLPIDTIIISELIKLSDKINLAIIEDIAVENHMFNYIDDEGVELLINSPIKFVSDNQVFCNGIKLTTRCDKITNNTACSILFIQNKKEWNNLDDIVNIPNVYIAYTFDEVVELINFFADNMELVVYE